MKPLDLTKPMFIELAGSDNISFTAHGKAQLTERIARVGYSIDDIKTKKQALEAIKMSEWQIFNQLHDELTGDSATQKVLSDLLCLPK